MDLPRELPLRIEPAPPEDWLVLRGGPHPIQQTSATARRSVVEFGRAIISAVVITPRDIHEILSRPPLCRFRVVRYCTVKHLTESGYTLLPTFRTPHFSIVLPDAADLTVARLAATLSQEMENPYADYQK